MSTYAAIPDTATEETVLQTASHYCRLNDEPLKKIEMPSVNVYVRLSNACNANCDFCSFHGERKTFNEEKFMRLLANLRRKIKINKLSFTGGEPTLDFPLFQKMLEFVNILDSDIFTVVNTNGLHLLELNKLNINSVALSRHHYDDKINASIFKAKTPSSDNIKNYNNDNLHLSCNLIKNYIDSDEQIMKYLDWCDSVNVKDVGFVGLMLANDYCKEHFVSTDIIHNMKRFIKTKTYSKQDGNKITCKCSNFLYGGNNLISVYCRHYVCDNNESVVVYDCDTFKNGFNGNCLDNYLEIP